MTTELTVTHTVTEAGLVANSIATKGIFNDYQQRKSCNSLHAHLTDLGTFACTPLGLQLIDTVEGLSREELETLTGLPILAA